MCSKKAVHWYDGLLRQLPKAGMLPHRDMAWKSAIAPSLAAAVPTHGIIVTPEVLSAKRRDAFPGSAALPLQSPGWRGS